METTMALRMTLIAALLALAACGVPFVPLV
jgi:predicted small lipoprotein YifL